MILLDFDSKGGDRRRRRKWGRRWWLREEWREEIKRKEKAKAGFLSAWVFFLTFCLKITELFRHHHNGVWKRTWQVITSCPIILFDSKGAKIYKNKHFSLNKTNNRVHKLLRKLTEGSFSHRSSEATRFSFHRLQVSGTKAPTSLFRPRVKPISFHV